MLNRGSDRNSGLGRRIKKIDGQSIVESLRSIRSVQGRDEKKKKKKRSVGGIVCIVGPCRPPSPHTPHSRGSIQINPHGKNAELPRKGW